MTAQQSFLVIPQSIARRPLSAWAKLVWGQLRFHRNQFTGQCNPRSAKLAEELGTSKDTVQRAIRELRRAGLVTTVKRIRASSYALHEFPQVENRHVEDAENPKPSGSRQCKSAALDNANPRVKTMQIRGSKELDQRNQINGNNGAADVTRSVCKPAHAAAAAAPPRRQQKTQRPASPPASVEQPEQLGFDLKPEPEPEPAPPVLAMPDQIAGLAQAMTRELAKVHPSPGLPNRAAPEVERILRSSPNVEATAERIWNNHAAWMGYWKTLPFGRFIPHLWRWFRDGDWENPPVMRKPMLKADWVAEEAKRIHREKLARRAAGC